MSLELGDLLIRDGKTLLFFRFGQGDPQAAPRAELVVLGKDVLHLLRGVARLEGGNVSVVLHKVLRSLATYWFFKAFLYLATHVYSLSSMQPEHL